MSVGGAGRQATNYSDPTLVHRRPAATNEPTVAKNIYVNAEWLDPAGARELAARLIAAADANEATP